MLAGKKTPPGTGHRTEEITAPLVGTPLHRDGGREIQVVWGEKRKDIKFAS